MAGFLFNLTGLILTAVLLTGCGSSNSEPTHIEADWSAEGLSTAEEAGDMTVIDGDDESSAEPVHNPSTALSVPTQITRIGDFYFIVDCYNDQVIYSPTLDAPLNEWYVMTGDINKGHTVASDGEVYLTDDTERHRILAFVYDGNRFVNTQIFENIGSRPHFIVYNEADKSFYVWSSMTGQMYVFERDPGTLAVHISRIMTLDELNGVYVRSFTIEGNSIYLVSGNSQVIEAGLTDFRIKKRFAVPDELAGMIQIMPVPGGYYITVSTDVHGNQDFATIIYTEELSDLEKGAYTDIYSFFVGGGTPYYMGSIDGRYYLTEHRLPGHSIWAFDIGEDHMPVNVEAVY